MDISYIYLISIPYIQEVQSRFSENENFLHWISQILDPAYVFNIIVPVLATINTLLTANVLMVSIIVEWLNIILKWYIMEDRPYWWVREYNINKKSYPYLKQGLLTCETSPGCPSGHVMSAAAMLYVLINAFLNYSNRKSSATRNKFLKIVCWSFYVIILIIVSISRMYIATHFPHQCVLGGILGFVIGYYFGRIDSKITIYWHDSSKLKLLSFVITGTLIAISTYWLQKAFGIDPQWSVKMAFKWCEQVENVHVSTTPLFCLVRDIGLALGMVSISPILLKTSIKRNLLVSVACVLFYCIALHLAQLSIPKHDVKIFYGFHALLFSTMPFVLIGVIPKVAIVKQKNN